MHIRTSEKIRVFYKPSDDSSSENIYTGIISNFGNEQRRCYMSVFMATDLKLEFLEECTVNDRGYADVEIGDAWITCDTRSRPALYIKSGRVKK